MSKENHLHINWPHECKGFIAMAKEQLLIFVVKDYYPTPPSNYHPLQRSYFPLPCMCVVVFNSSCLLNLNIILTWFMVMILFDIWKRLERIYGLDTRYPQLTYKQTNKIIRFSWYSAATFSSRPLSNNVNFKRAAIFKMCTHTSIHINVCKWVCMYESRVLNVVASGYHPFCKRQFLFVQLQSKNVSILFARTVLLWFSSSVHCYPVI